jgi:hypothetical protein
VAGLPVVQVKMQQCQGERPMFAVDQQLASGEVIRTVEGPADQVSGIMSRPGAPSPASSRAVAETTMAIRDGNRMLMLMGRVPSDSLKALMLRVKPR